MGDVISLKPAALLEDHGFVVDMARFREGLLDEKSIRKKYRLANDVWESFGENDALVRQIEDESIRRIRDGSSKREKAQLLVVKAPDVLSGILQDSTQSARHRIDSAKVLNDFAANPQDHTPTTSDRFIITINLGADHVEHYDKSISINADDTPDDGGRAPQRSLPVANKWDSDDDDVVATPAKASAPMRTGYKQVDREVTANKRPAAHKPVELKIDSRSAYDIALASLMEKG